VTQSRTRRKGTSDLIGHSLTLAHNGVLFLDELTEFHRDALETLRQPLEDGRVVVTRIAGTVEFPARFTLVAAANPCPCGFDGDPWGACRCPTNREEETGSVSGRSQAAGGRQPTANDAGQCRHKRAAQDHFPSIVAGTRIGPNRHGTAGVVGSIPTSSSVVVLSKGELSAIGSAGPLARALPGGPPIGTGAHPAVLPRPPLRLGSGRVPALSGFPARA